MEKKYYELIVSLIRNHRKFAGYESILDDIVEDVYNHAKIVMDSVTNEEVIISYLTKVIGTSIITVPKKLNINTRVKHHSITIEPQPVQEIIKEEPPAPQPVTENIVEQDINEVQEFPIEEEEIFVENNDNEVETLVLEQNSVDKTLVDKMINGAIEEPVIEEVAEEIELPEELEEISEQIFEPEEATEELLLEESAPELEENLEITESEPEEEPIAEENFIEESITEPETEQEELNLQTEDNFLIEENTDEPVLEEVEELNISEEFSTDLPEEKTVLEEELLEDGISDTEMEAQTANFALPNYDCFKFNPEKAEFDEQEINSEIAEIESKHPEKQISRICSLKYSKNLSVSEIASAVEMSEEDVLDVLNEIIDIVKD